MSELIVFAFPSETGASEMDETIHKLKKEELMVLADAAVVIRKPDGKIKVKQATDLVGAGAFGGAFWGMLIGFYSGCPGWDWQLVLSQGQLQVNCLIMELMMTSLKKQVKPLNRIGSAIFLLISKWTEDKALDRLKKFNATILRTSLSNEDELKLKAAFGAGE